MKQQPWCMQQINFFMIGQVMPGRVKYFFNQQWLKHDIFSKLLQYNFPFFGKEVIMLKDPRLKVLLIGCKQGLYIKECLQMFYVLLLRSPTEGNYM